MHDDDDDIDDTMAANPENPERWMPIGNGESVRVDASGDLAVRSEPRRRKPTSDAVGRWEIVWREGVAPDELTERRERTANRCRMCGDPDPSGVLHPCGDDIRRNVCGPCQGVYNMGRR